MDLYDYENNLADFVKELIDANMLEGAALGVAKLFVDKGKNTLSQKQTYVFDNFVIKNNIIKECKRCGNEIPWCEMFPALSNGKLCNYCWYMSEKGKRE